MEMTKQEFMEWLVSEFGGWTASRSRERLFWLLSLQEFVEKEFNRAYEEKYQKEAK